ncbi:MAG: ParM/StbA family protein [Clostridium sartagoforme]|nr:ParM/StbA family protein [Clostridium sartagoforme]
MINVTVDLGNYSIKYAGENVGSFSSRISTLFNPNPEAYDRIQIGNEITYIGIGEYDRQFSKIDKNYLPSLLFAITEATNESDINLCLLLPLVQMNNSSKFINRLKNSSFTFLVNGNPRTININKVAVLGEGFISQYMIEDNKEDILICDIGSRTINYVTIINGKTEYNYTERLGVLDLYSNIKDIENSKGEDFVEEDIERLIKNGRIVVDSRIYLDFLKLILNRIQAKVNIKNYKVYFTGGGSLMLKDYIEKNTPAKVLENAQFSNVLGAHKIAEIGWRRASK